MAAPSPGIEIIFFDVGGVLLTNGWDTAARRSFAAALGLDWDEFQTRHELVVEAFETDDLDLDGYLARTIFFRPRPFDRAAVEERMKAPSRPLPESLRLLDELVASPRAPTLAVLNNESRFLNDYRIDRFGLRERFVAFLSSCYLGVRKPHERIYRIAVDVMGARPDACLFVDDRPLNLECAAALGIRTHRFTDADELRERLVDEGLLP